MDIQKKFKDFPLLDKDIIKNIPWAENMKSVLQDGLDRTFLYWCQLVLQMGEEESIVKEWVNTFVETYETTCCELVSDMQCLQTKILSILEEQLQTIQQLCRTLQIKPPEFATQNLSLHRERQEYSKLIDKYQNMISERQAELDKIREKQMELCNSLGKEPKKLRDDPLPSSEEVEEFQKHVEKMEVEKFKRLERFLLVKEELLPIVEELKLEPSSTFEQMFLSLDDSAFLVTDANMKQLEHFYRDLIKQQKCVKEEIAQLRDKVDDYWNLLDVELKEREEFRQKYTGNSIPVLDALRAEVKKCESLKKANIKIFIDKLRTELEQVWDKCHCSQIIRSQFDFFHSDCYNEDLLELHEVEIGKWRKYYNENKELLTLLEKHQRLWNNMLELEENATGPNRYNNRGGQLLKEEKERNKLAKQIPQIEDTLRSLAEKYIQVYGTSFTTNGLTVPEHLENLHEQRDNAKKIKLSARKIQRDQTITPAKSVQNLFPSTSRLTPRRTPLSKAKRKLATPGTNDSKRLKVMSEKKHKENRTLIVPTIKITCKTSPKKRYSQERKKRMGKTRANSVCQQEIHENDSLSEDYLNFQSTLSSKNDCRSTIIPKDIVPSQTTGKLLDVKSIAVSPRTPLKTPTMSRSRARTPDTANKLSTAKSNIKLIF